MNAGRSAAGRLSIVSPVVLQQLHDRVHGFAVPSGPFDPTAASPQDLDAYGLPPRPGPHAPPVLQATWNAAFDQTLIMQPYVFEAGLVNDTAYRPHRRRAAEMVGAETRVEASSNWSGAYITANRDRHFLQIWGTWNVPGSLALPPAPFRGPLGIPYTCANWIGLDGQRRYFDSSLPQMGTQSTLAGSVTTVQAWTQWWARGVPGSAPLPLTIKLSPGDRVACVMTAHSPQHVRCVMVNKTQGYAMAWQWIHPPTVSFPDGTTGKPDIFGATAEWVLERPAIPTNVLGPPPEQYNFPDYGHSGFDHCLAVEADRVDFADLANGIPQQLQGARLIRMFDVLQAPARTQYISMPKKLNDATVRLKYGSF